MPRSDTELLEYYPEHWDEAILDQAHVEWRYRPDDRFRVQLAVDDSPPRYYVRAITGVTDAGDPLVADTISGLTARQAFAVARSLLYAITGTVERLQNGGICRGDR